MHELPKPVRSALLIVAAGFIAVACGDDAADRGDVDGGRDGGATDRPGDSGPGGDRDGGGDGRADAGSDAGAVPTSADCRERAVQTAGAACVACVCEAGPAETVACGPDCWALVACIQVQCGGDGSDFPCITSMCDDFLIDDAPLQAIDFDPIVRMCSDPCVAPLVGVGSELDGGS